ncbi:MAG: PKD domain-containing protein, partial [Anaerolineae bacterium]
ISYSTIRNNFARRNGGGLYLTGSNARLIGNTIVDNDAGQGGSSAGGGLYLINANPEIRGNVIRGNGVHVSGSFSTPYGSGGAIFARSANPTIADNLIVDNYVNGQLNSYARGGALYLYYADPDIVNNTFANNSAGTGDGGVYDVDQGGAIYAYHSEPVLVNNIFWNDTPQEIFATASAVAQAITIAYSDVQGGQAGLVLDGTATVNWLQGNQDADPLFVDPAAGDYTLQPGSPAIDAGTAYFEWLGRIIVDLQPGEYNGAAPDQGAFEAEGGGTPNQPPVAVASADPQSGMAPLTVQFSADGSSDPDGTIVAYAWTFGDGSASSEANPTYTYNGAGTYQVTLTVTDDGGATADDTLTIDVSQANQPPVAVASADPQSGMAPLTVQFSADGSSDPDGTIVAYAWYFGDGSASSEANPTYTFNGAGTYQVTLTVTDDGGATADDTLTIQVDDTMPGAIHVLSQEVGRRDNRKWAAGYDTVIVVDQQGNPVSGATVVADYYGPNQGQVSGVTNKDGKVLLKTERVRNPEGIWCFEVVNIFADGYLYDAGANIVTVQCEMQVASPSGALSDSDAGAAPGR